MYPPPNVQKTRTLTILRMRLDQIGFVLKRIVPQRRARGYLKKKYSFVMFTPNWRARRYNTFYVGYTCTFPSSPHHFLVSRLIN